MTVRKKRVYVAGPMRGYPDFNFPAFDAAVIELRDRGFKVFSPAERDKGIGFNPTGMAGTEADMAAVGFSVREALAADLEWICKEADVVVVLPGWERSSGTAAEVAAARALSIPVVPLKEFLTGVAEPKRTIEQEAGWLVRDGDRQKTYGHPRGDFDRVGKMWSAILDTDVSAEQVAIMMIAFKLARLSQTPQHRDSKVDTIGYVICLDRLDEPVPDEPERLDMHPDAVAMRKYVYARRNAKAA